MLMRHRVHPRWGQPRWTLDGRSGPKSVCGTLLLNFGQWAASWQAARKSGGGVWSLERYGAAVEGALAWAKGVARRQGTAVAWVSTYPAPLNDGTGIVYQTGSSAVHADLTHCPPTAMLETRPIWPTNRAPIG